MEEKKKNYIADENGVCAIKDGVEWVSSYQIRNSPDIKKVIIPASVTNIYKRAFGHSILLEEFSVSEENKNYSSVDGVLFNKDKTELVLYPCAKKDEEYTVPEGVTSIGEKAFRFASNLKKVVLPDSVTVIENQAFSFCENLGEISLGSGVKKIENSAFLRCDSLKEITLPEGLEKIEGSAFGGCGGLSQIFIPRGVKEICAGAFSGSGLVHIFVDDRNENYISANGVLFNKEETELVCFPCGRNGSYEIPSGVKTIRNAAFGKAYHLESVVMPNTVTKIGDGAFMYCYGLKKVTLGSGVKEIGEDAFERCRSLSEINLPEGLEKIDDFAFCDCISLQGIFIPESVKKVGAQPFDSTNVTVDEKNENYSSYDGALFDKDKTELICVNSRGLTSYEIPSGVSKIATSAFEEAKDLECVTIPLSVKKICEEVFCCCGALKDVNYAGSKDEWGKIKVGDCNDGIDNSTIHCLDGDIAPKEDDEY